MRNTFGANISFRADVFENLEGFNEQFGKDHGHNLQGEETELAARMYKRYSKRLYYRPDALVEHRVYLQQLDWGWLFNRAFWQGFTKGRMDRTIPESMGAEKNFVKVLLTRSVPAYIYEAKKKRSARPLIITVSMLALTMTVGLGYLSERISNLTNETSVGTRSW